MAGALRRFIPLFDRVLVQKAEAVTKTSSGILIPEKSVAKVLFGKVMAVGEGVRTESGQVIPPAVAVGDEVMLPEFGGTKITLEEKDFYLFRDSELLAKLKSE
ncbi:10 kDa heat shock protein, mitochondrial-like [Homarus americanus]|uniref:10 kDa heat shock protein, mitochondrial-like n=1 Tax=Homarus americanus TaxID=6706 RepID=UPI001C48DC7D|nr:10 kDa heat shock protein, mitochondrial-like [Homarus americanus]